MVQWQPLCIEKISYSNVPDNRVVFQVFEVKAGLKGIRVRCEGSGERMAEQEVQDLYDDYTNHPLVQDEQKKMLLPYVLRHHAYWKKHCCTFLIFDPSHIFRGSLSSGESGWKMICPDINLEESELPAGEWIIQVVHLYGLTWNSDWMVEIEGTTEEAGVEPVPLKTYAIQEFSEQTHEPSWRVGELFETIVTDTQRQGIEEQIQRYQSLGYSFCGLSALSKVPVRSFLQSFEIGIIAGQEIITACGGAFLPGTREVIRAFENNQAQLLQNIIYETHSQGGLFCLLNPFSIRELSMKNLPLSEEDWQAVDFLQVWSGVWREKFPEILKALDLWDRLLNRGHRIYAVCGKSAEVEISDQTVEMLPKLIVLSESTSEADLLMGMKLGQSYMTVEPAISLWIESEYGGGAPGDEVHLPVGAPFLLYFEISCIQRGGFVKVKSNEGILCEMPVSSVRNTQQKFILSAQENIQWFRLELYQYGRPLDELLALSNPVFVRGMISV